jgi:predicted DNA-binding transcriptional regulator AlpA
MSVKHLKTKDVAERLGYSVDHFRKAIKNSPSFPKPKQIKLG